MYENVRTHGFISIIAVTPAGWGGSWKCLYRDWCNFDDQKSLILQKLCSQFWAAATRQNHHRKQKKRHQATQIIQSLSNCSVTERLLEDIREGDDIRRDELRRSVVRTRSSQILVGLCGRSHWSGSLRWRCHPLQQNRRVIVYVQNTRTVMRTSFF